MTYFDISEAEIKEKGRFELEPPYEPGESTKLVATSPSYTDPMLVVDGIDKINVLQEDSETYLIDFHGFESGYLRVTEAGVVEFGENYLGDEDGIPSWYVEGFDESNELPDWIPDTYQPQTTIECVRCGKEISVVDMVTPGRAEGDAVDWFCRDCWQDVRERWSSSWVYAGKPDVHRADYLDGTVGGDPESADIDELVELTNSEEEKAQMHALVALGRIIPERADDIEKILPILTDKLDADAILTRFGALNCIAMLAENDPEAGLPVVDDVVLLLDPSSDGGILEEAIQFVLAMSEEYPQEVRDAVSRLSTLLSEDPPQEDDLIEAVVNIAKEEPDSVAPVASDLCEYVENEDSDKRAYVIAALEYVGKEFPEVAETAIPTMIDLLNESNPRLRTNAVGLLADLSENYPAQLTYDIDQIINLVDDSDENAQHNATYVLANIASQYPEEVRPAVDDLIEALNADSAETRVDTRVNICQALGYTESQEATGPLEERRDDDPSDEVRQAAGWALGQIR